MESLKTYMKVKFTETIRETKKTVKKLEETHARIADINFNKAPYIVSITSNWIKEGEDSTRTTHIGKLEDAIKKAEKEFKTKNKRQNIDGSYAVEVTIGTRDVIVPEAYWQRYTKP